MTNTSDKVGSTDSKANIIRYNNQQCKKHNKRTKSSQDKGNGEMTENSKSDTKRKLPHPSVTYVPDTNLTLACLVCLCFNFPLGAIAMYLSLSAARAYRDGDARSGDIRAKSSVWLSLFSIVSTVLIVMSIVLWVVIQNQAKKDLRGVNR